MPRLSMPFVRLDAQPAGEETNLAALNELMTKLGARGLSPRPYRAQQREVAPGITLIALVSDAPGTKELKELSLAINTPDGIVLVVGCSHPDIETIVAEAAKINPHIHFIAGGFHLVVAQDAAIEKATTRLHDTYKVDYIAPGHCTGEPTFAAMQRMFGDRYLYAGLGTTLGVGAVPRVESDRSA